MIEIGASTAFLLYLGFTLAVLFGLWLLSHLKGRKEVEKRVSSSVLNTCDFCHFVYMQELQENITQCPQCKSYNKKTN